MLEIFDITQLARVPGPVHLCLGMFDGVHLGHRSLCERALVRKQERGGSVVVLTFDPHPAAVLRPASRPPLLTGARHRRRILAGLGVDSVLTQTFDEAFARWEAVFFLDRLRGACQLDTLVTGRNYRFGRGGAGDTNLLRHYAAEHGLSCLVCPPVEVGGVLVSSTNIRGLVAEGRLEEAAACLGRSYSCYGQVVEGRKWARTIGFPTANYALDNEVLPPPGVWTFSTEWDGGTAYGIGNLGTRPTFGGGGSPVLEIHWLDREADLYGRWMEIVFGRRLRTEMTFGSPDELSAQISRDVARARQWAAGCATAGASR